MVFTRTMRIKLWLWKQLSIVSRDQNLSSILDALCEETWLLFWWEFISSLLVPYLVLWGFIPFILSSTLWLCSFGQSHALYSKTVRIFLPKYTKCIFAFIFYELFCCLFLFFYFYIFQVAGLFRDPSIGNAINIVVVRLVLLEQDEVSHPVCRKPSSE